MEKLNAVILAAGEGTRMKSKTAKVLHKVCNKTMVEYVIDAAKEVGCEKICVVIGHGADSVKDELENKNVDFAIQAQRLGTGHAVMMAEKYIEEDKDILILYGDTPLLRSETLEKLVSFHRKEKNGVSIISAIVDDPKGYGHIIRNEKGEFVKNVEHKDASDDEKKVKEINTGVYIFNGKALKLALSKITNDNVQGEYYLPDALEILLKDGYGVNAMVADDVSEFFGVNSRVQLAEAAKIMRKRINTYYMENGVTIVDPDNTYIDAGVEIGEDTIVYPGCMIEGNTVIGCDCKIGPNTNLKDTTVGNSTSVKSSTVTESKIGDNTNVGPYAYIRPNCVIGNEVKIGDFVEVKNSNIGNGTKVSHLTYIGDSDVGERINFGCGTVTVNYDGSKKFRTVIEDDVFIGCNTNLVAPVKVNKGAYIAAGSTITDEVPENSLAIARSRQINKFGWIKPSK